tara:strand:+ start:371 stop:1078 length:708 start_codon:yes stop_codon:yes gene_type:complete
MEKIVLVVIIIILVYLINKNNNKNNINKNKNNNINDADEIIPNLWLGNKNAALDNNFLKNNNIKLVVNSTKDIPFNNLNIEKIRLNVNNKNKMLKYTDLINNKIDQYRKENDGVLVHCNKGLQRSPALVGNYLLNNNRNLSLEDVIKLISNKRNIIFRPNSNYKNTMNFYYKSLKIQNSICDYNPSYVKRLPEKDYPIGSNHGDNLNNYALTDNACPIFNMIDEPISNNVYTRAS